MKRLLSGLLAFLIAALPAQAGMLVNSYWASPGIRFIGSLEDDTNAATYTFAGANIGTADSTRIVVVTAMGSTGVANALNSATIAGVAATIVIQAETTTHARAAIIQARVPSGTTGDIVLNYAGSYSRMVIGVYTIKNAALTAADSQSDVTGATAQRSLTLNVPKNGVVIAADANQTAVANSVWTGVTEDFDISCEALDQCTGAHGGPLTPNATYTVQVDHTGSSDSALVAAAWAQ